MLVATNILLAIACVQVTSALECAVILGETKKELKEVIKTCLIPTIPVVVVKVDNTTKPANFTDEDEPELPPIYGPRRGMGRRNKREDVTTIAPVVTTVSTTTTSAPLKPTVPFENKSKKNKDPKKCVVRCILKEFQMLDGKKMPDHNKVSEGLLKNIEHREFRDFIQDSIDDCFGQMLELVGADSCGYAAKLITCLAEKGRYNCADWPVGELPFPHPY